MRRRWRYRLPDSTIAVAEVFHNEGAPPGAPYDGWLLLQAGGKTWIDDLSRPPAGLTPIDRQPDCDECVIPWDPACAHRRAGDPRDRGGQTIGRNEKGRHEDD